MNSVFTTSFIDRILTSLEANCPVGAGVCITRTKLATELGLDSKLRLESALGVLVTSGQVPGWEVRKGPKGGIGRVGEKIESKPSKPSVPELTDEFKGQLMAALQMLCDAIGTPVPRKDLAAYIGNEKAPPMISAAINLDEFYEFETKIGKGGGVRRKVAIVAEIETSDDVAPDTQPIPDSNLGEDLAASMEDNTSDPDTIEAVEELAVASNL